MFKSNHLILITFLFCTCNVLASTAFGLISKIGFSAASTKYFGTSLLVWAAIIIVSSLLLEIKSAEASRKELTLAFLTMLLCLIPSSTLNWLTLGTYALLLSPTKNLRPAMILIAIIAFREPIVTQNMRLFSQYIVQFDAWFVALASHISTAELQQVGNILISSAGHAVMILEGCSSFANLSLALLLYYSLTLSLKEVRYLILIFISIIFLNSIRLVLMTQNLDYFIFLHTDMGATIFEIVIISNIIAIALIRNKYHA